MAQTPIPTNEWLQLAEDVIPWATVGGLMYRAIDRVFKYFSDKQKEEVKALIHAVVTPDIDRLNQGLERLEKAIWGLEKSINK